MKSFSHGIYLLEKRFLLLIQAKETVSFIYGYAHKKQGISTLYNTLFGTENYDPSFIVKTLGKTIMDKTGVTDKTKPENTDKYDDTHGADGT